MFDLSEDQNVKCHRLKKNIYIYIRQKMWKYEEKLCTSFRKIHIKLMACFASFRRQMDLFSRDFKEYHTDTTVKFIIKMNPEKLRNSIGEGLHKVFKLQTAINTSSMVTSSFFFFIHNECFLAGAPYIQVPVWYLFEVLNTPQLNSCGFRHRRS